MARIMLCDDNNTVRTLLERKLTLAGHQIVGKAKDGNEGVAVFSETKPEITILDITMPNKDGRACLQEILQIDASAKVIMVSALQDSEVVQFCLQNGAKGFVQKEKLYKEEDFKSEFLALIDKVIKAA